MQETRKAAFCNSATGCRFREGFLHRMSALFCSNSAQPETINWVSFFRCSAITLINSATTWIKRLLLLLLNISPLFLHAKRALVNQPCSRQSPTSPFHKDSATQEQNLKVFLFWNGVTFTSKYIQGMQFAFWASLEISRFIFVERRLRLNCDVRSSGEVLDP